MNTGKSSPGEGTTVVEKSVTRQRKPRGQKVSCI